MNSITLLILISASAIIAALFIVHYTRKRSGQGFTTIYIGVFIGVIAASISQMLINSSIPIISITIPFISAIVCVPVFVITVLKSETPEKFIKVFLLVFIFTFILILIVFPAVQILLIQNNIEQGASDAQIIEYLKEFNKEDAIQDYKTGLTAILLDIAKFYITLAITNIISLFVIVGEIFSGFKENIPKLKIASLIIVSILAIENIMLATAGLLSQQKSIFTTAILVVLALLIEVWDFKPSEQKQEVTIKKKTKQP